MKSNVGIHMHVSASYEAIIKTFKKIVNERKGSFVASLEQSLSVKVGVPFQCA